MSSKWPAIRPNKRCGSPPPIRRGCWGSNPGSRPENPRTSSWWALRAPYCLPWEQVSPHILRLVCNQRLTGVLPDKLWLLRELHGHTLGYTLAKIVNDQRGKQLKIPLKGSLLIEFISC